MINDVNIPYRAVLFWIQREEVRYEDCAYGVMDTGSRAASSLLGLVFDGKINEKYRSKTNPGFESYFVKIGEKLRLS